MAKGIYLGVDGVTRKVKKIYFGVNGMAKKVKKIYLGVGGIARLCYTDGVAAGQVIFTSSQIWTVPEGVKTIDIFVVGGGGYGSATYTTNQYVTYYGGGAGAGYTKTSKNISVAPGQQISVTIGAGSSNGSYGGSGGGSLFGNLLSITGGMNANGNNGGDGGSGGGHGFYNNRASNSYRNQSNGGINGSDGAIGTTSGSSPPSCVSGKGQGTTTRAFGEHSNTLYSTGGIGGYGSTNNSNGIPNTGNGGSGNVSGGAGGSGIIIVRWAEQ